MVYGIHITQKNRIGDVMSQEFVELARKHGAALVMDCKDPARYLASLVVPTREKQQAFHAGLKQMGIDAEADTSPSYVEQPYPGEYASKGV